MGAALRLCGRDDAAADYRSRRTISNFDGLMGAQKTAQAQAAWDVAGGRTAYAGATCETVGMAPRRNASSDEEGSDVGDDGGGALFRSARQRRKRLQRRNDGSVRNIDRGVGGERIDLVRQERQATTLTDSVVERLIAASTQLGDGNHGKGGLDPATPSSSLKEQSSCDTSIYASGESDGSNASEAATHAVDQIINEETLDIKLFPIKRPVQTLTDEQVGALLSRSI